MQELREIIQVIERYGVEDGLLPECMRREGRESLMQRLYTGIAEGRYRSDADAVAALYGRATAHAAYRQLKSRLRRQVLHAVLGLDIRQPKHTAVVGAIYNCAKDAAIARILVSLGARSTGITLAHKTLKQAQEAHLHNIVFQCAQLLRSHYSLIGLEKQFNEYHRIVKEVLRIQEAEAEADSLKEKLMVKYARSTSKKGEFAKFARVSVERLRELREKYSTHTVMANYFRVKSLYYQIAGEYSALVAVCDEAEQYYEQHPHFSTKIRLAEFALTKMVAFLHLRDYERGELNAQRCRELYLYTSNNWFVFMWYYFLLCSHTQKFVRAVEVFHEVSTHPRIESRPEFELEKWRVNEGYLHYVFESGWETTRNEQVEVFCKRFSVHKLLNEVPTYSKDKRGMNVSILVLQVLFLVERGEYGAISSRTDALGVYSKRYLSTTDTRRSRAFMKLLLLLEQHDFEYARVERVGRRHYDLLRGRSLEYSHPDDAEIIPFELLWERVLLRIQRGV